MIYEVDAPLYEHDCDHCTFHGVVWSAFSCKWYDLYTCADSTVVRKSSEGSDYESGHRDLRWINHITGIELAFDPSTTLILTPDVERIAA